MSFRQLIEPECGNINPLMQFGNQITRDVSFKDEGLSHRHDYRHIDPIESTTKENELVNEFLGQAAVPPDTFQMDALLQEMRMIESRDFQSPVINAPRVIDEVTNNLEWAKEFLKNDTRLDEPTASINELPLQLENESTVTDFWELQSPIQPRYSPISEEVIRNSNFNSQQISLIREALIRDEEIIAHKVNEPTLTIVANSDKLENLSEEASNRLLGKSSEHEDSILAEKELSLYDDWISDFPKSVAEETQKTAEYNQKFWDNLQDEWKKLSEESNADTPWLSEFTNYYDPYKEYTFTEENPMLNDNEALKKGKLFLEKGDIPNAVLCFEAAVKQEPENAEAWELLGTSQAENEMDPHAIAAMKKSLELNPENMKVLMALAVSYTNESLQSQALKMLISWLEYNPKYSHLVEKRFPKDSDESKILTNSIINRLELKEIQDLFLEAVKQNPNDVDPDIQEALGVLFTLSSEYDKAVDCFKAALQVRPDNAKVWNRLGASLANGNRSVESVEAYQRALEIAPGFIRARYNVGIVCMNLKAYKEAVEHLLAALNLQASSSLRSGIDQKAPETNQMSDTIWSTLRMVISLMGKFDLQNAINARDLNTLNKVFGDSNENANGTD